MTTAPATKQSSFNRPTKPYVNPYLGGAILGVVLFLAFLSPGTGSSCETARIDAAIVDAVVSQHVDTTPYLLKMAGGDKNPLTRRSCRSSSRPVRWLLPALRAVSSSKPEKVHESRTAIAGCCPSWVARSSLYSLHGADAHPGRPSPGGHAGGRVLAGHDGHLCQCLASWLTSCASCGSKGRG